MGAHHHHHDKELPAKKLLITIFLNIGITAAQLIGGFFSGSLALMSDAVHNFGDVLGLIGAYIATQLSRRDATLKHTFGYKRAEIFAAFINAIFLVVTAFYIIIEAFDRLESPQSIEATWVIILALVGIAFNGFSVFLIKDETDNLNMRAAYLHLMGDVLTSVAVFVSGIILLYFPIYWIDAVLSIAIAIYLLYSAWGILKETTAIFMNFTPSTINLKALEQLCCEHEMIKNIHDLHIWPLNEHDIYFEAHIEFTQDLSLSESAKIINELETQIHEKFGIHHITFQPEFGTMGAKNLVHQH